MTRLIVGIVGKLTGRGVHSAVNCGSKFVASALSIAMWIGGQQFTRMYPNIFLA
jgi:hypothetical protein